MPDELRDIRTEAVEDFLKTVYVLQRQAEQNCADQPIEDCLVPTTALAQALNISAPSVTDMVKRLAGIEEDKDRKRRDTEPEASSLEKNPLLYYKPYRGVRLTPMGEKIALEVIRHHRLLELYLSQALGYSWDEVHEEADRLEHAISERFEARIAAALGNPKIDPHGDPIPTLEGTISAPELVLLSDLPIEQGGTVSRITDQTPEVLRYLSELGLTPGTAIKLTARAPLNDTVSIHIDNGQETHTISTQVARKVLVTR